MTTVTTTCTAILRAATGPCEACGFSPEGEGKAIHNTDLDFDTDLIATGFIYMGPPHHPYLGPSLGVCGHAEDEHYPDEPVERVPAHCGPCFLLGETARGSSHEHVFATTPEPVGAT